MRVISQHRKLTTDWSALSQVVDAIEEISPARCLRATMLTISCPCRTMQRIAFTGSPSTLVFCRVKARQMQSKPIKRGTTLTKRLITVMTASVLLTAMCFGEGDREKLRVRLDKAGTILDEITTAPDKGVPQEILAHAQCVGVIPTMMKAGFGFGAEYGQGVVTCRTGKGWSAPAFYRLGGGTFGLQIGGQAVDVVMLFMNDRGVESLM